MIPAISIADPSLPSQPRHDRDESFEPKLVHRRFAGFDEKISALHARGLWMHGGATTAQWHPVLNPIPTHRTYALLVLDFKRSARCFERRFAGLTHLFKRAPEH